MNPTALDLLELVREFVATHHVNPISICIDRDGASVHLSREEFGRLSYGKYALRYHSQTSSLPRGVSTRQPEPHGHVELSISMGRLEVFCLVQPGESEYEAVLL